MSPPANPGGNKSKLLIAVLVGIIIVLLAALAVVASYKMGERKGAGQPPEQSKIEASSPFPGFPNGTIQQGAGEKITISEKEKLPEIISGKIASVSDGKLTVKQFASIDLNYEIGKEDVASVKVLKKNPEFDENKAEEMREKMAEKLKEAESKGNSNQNSTPAGNPPETKEIGKEANGDPSLQMFNEAEGGWSDLREGAQIGVTFNKDKKAEIIVYPEDFPIGPPVGPESRQEEPIILPKM